MPTYKTPQRFPGVASLPPMVQQLVESLFPPDQLPTPAVTTIPAARIGQLRSLIGETREALTPPPVDPLRSALLGRVTPTKVPHRTPLRIPEGFELPQGTSPYPSRAPGLIDKFVEQRSYHALLPTKRSGSTYRTTNRLGKDVMNDIKRKVETPKGNSLEDAMLAAKASGGSGSAPVKKPLLGHSGFRGMHYKRNVPRPPKSQSGT